MDKQRSYPELIERYRCVADEIGARMNEIGRFSCPMGEYPMFSMTLETGSASQRICISTGMHGDEPAGPETLLLGLRRLAEHRDRLNARFLIFPCDNPTGWELNTRENWAGVDLNREFSKTDQAAEIAIVENHVRGKKLDFTYDLHEDIDTAGMYLYERARKGRAGLAGDMIGALRERGYPIHEADWIEGLPASGGIIWPTGRLRRFELPKAVYLWHQGVPHLITTESPGKLPLKTRIEMQLVCFDLFIEAIAEERFREHRDLHAAV